MRTYLLLIIGGLLFSTIAIRRDDPFSGDVASIAVRPEAENADGNAGDKPADAPAVDPTIVDLKVYPADVQLQTSRDRQSLVVQATHADGLTSDVTGQAKLTAANPGVVKLDGALALPAGDGATEIKVEFSGRTVVVPATVKDAATDRAISFKLDVMPIFAKSGCNMGSCHGAARGKDGFRLSLFGYDHEGDYQRITREISGRRINLALPKNSLLVEKSLGKVPHTGGQRFSEDSEFCQTMVRWLEAGAPADTGELPTLTALELSPPGAVLNGKDAAQRLTVRAKYSDGSDRDVTSLATFMSNNDTSAKVSPEGLVTAADRGEAFVMARFDTMTVGSHFVVLPKDLKFEFPQVAEQNYIDTLINNKLKKLRIAPSELCSDEEFLRRASLDIVGLLPTPEEYTRFTTRSEPNKRELLVDELLARKEFVEMWVMKWAELLQIRSTNEVSPKAMLLYYNWLQSRIAGNVPMDQMVQELLSSSGGTFSNAATNYYQNERETLKVAENTAQIFMGMRIQCAQCHNHPFDRWTQDDYYSFAAFFAQVGRKRGEDPRENIVFDSKGGGVKHPVGDKDMKPKFLGGEVPEIKDQDRREVLAQWLASKENPYFATNLANIVWSHFFGRGIIEPVDDVRVSNPPANAELLAELGKRFTDYNYDFKKLVRDICTSRTYQLATRSNESNAGDVRNFSHASIRRIRAEVMLDAISQVTSTKDKFAGLPLGARAVQVADGNTSNYFLTTFGRATRATACSCEVKMDPNLSQALHLLNGDTLNQKIRQGGLIAERLKEQKPPDAIIEELYVRLLTRKPMPDEIVALNESLVAATDKRKALEDIFWALGNSREFLFNH